MSVSKGKTYSLQKVYVDILILRTFSRRGFSSFLGYYNGAEDYYQHNRRGNIPPHPLGYDFRYFFFRKAKFYQSFSKTILLGNPRSRLHRHLSRCPECNRLISFASTINRHILFFLSRNDEKVAPEFKGKYSAQVFAERAAHIIRCRFI